MALNIGNARRDIGNAGRDIGNTERDIGNAGRDISNVSADRFVRSACKAANTGYIGNRDRP